VRGDAFFAFSVTLLARRGAAFATTPVAVVRARADLPRFASECCSSTSARAVH